MGRPKIKIQPDAFDQLTEVIGIFALFTLIVLPAFYYGDLPERIPRHFDANGEPDGFGGKGMIWVLPVIGTVMYVGLNYLKKYPHVFNYPVTITEKNAEKQYRIAIKMIRCLNSLIAGLFAYMTYATIQTALGHQNGLGGSFLPVFLLLFFGSIGYFLVQALQEK